MSKIKILCIDDTPDEMLDPSSGATLRNILEGIYKPLKYDVIFEQDGEKGIEVAENKDIKLILLDVEFKQQKKQGEDIAKELLSNYPKLKVIVLTRIPETGTKISFGHKLNVVHYILKKKLSLKGIQDKLTNLSRAIIEDYENKNWKIKYVGSQTINLINNKTGKIYGIDIPMTAEPAILECMKSPNQPVTLPDTYGKNLHRVHKNINDNVRNSTEWNTWGILTKEGCAKGQLKLVIGSVEALPTSQIIKDPYVTQSQFERFLKEFQRFKEEVLTRLGDSSNKQNG